MGKTIKKKIFVYRFDMVFYFFELQNFPWVEADERETIIEDPKIIPLKVVNSDYMQV